MLERLYSAVHSAMVILPIQAGAVTRFKGLWALQRQALVSLGTSFSALMVASAAKARANDTFPGYRGSFPSSYLLTMSLFYVLILLAFYLPAQAALRKHGTEMAEALAGKQHGDDSAIGYHDALAKWRTALGIDVEIRTELERGIVLLSPLLSAAASTVFGSRSENQEHLTVAWSAGHVGLTAEARCTTYGVLRASGAR